MSDCSPYWTRAPAERSLAVATYLVAHEAADDLCLTAGVDAFAAHPFTHLFCDERDGLGHADIMFTVAKAGRGYPQRRL